MQLFLRHQVASFFFIVIMVNVTCCTYYSLLYIPTNFAACKMFDSHAVIQLDDRMMCKTKMCLFVVVHLLHSAVTVCYHGGEGGQ